LPKTALAPTKRAPRLASRGVILHAATTLFLRNGYLGTSMDDIAALASVSKQTVYTHFADKEQLFSELILGNIERVEEFANALTRALDHTIDLERDLHDLARSYIKTVIQPDVLALRRLVIAEAGRFPELARTYYERVPEQVFTLLAASLQKLAERGLMRLEDPRLAARQFAWLVLAIPLDKAMFYGESDRLTPPEIEGIADSAVHVFLAAYGAGKSP
jgi:TetR/AcrR family transcriptional repressor of mexJK operon